MTEEQMEKLAEIIFQKLFLAADIRYKQEVKANLDYGIQVARAIEFEIKSPYDEYAFGLTEKEKLEEEILELSKLLSQYEDNEEYEKAIVARDTLTKLMKKLNEL